MQVVTDLDDSRWLAYLLEEFIRIQQAEFEIRIIDIRAADDPTQAIFYTRDYQQNTNWIPARSGEIEGPLTRSADLIYLSKTIVHQTEGLVNFDLFWNAFAFLSRIWERNSEDKGVPIQSYAMRHPLRAAWNFDTPIVNYYFNLLQQIIEKHFTGLSFAANKRPEIELSHDLDYIHKTLQLRLKQTAFNSFNSIRNILRPATFFKHLKKTFQFIFSTPDYWQFNYWLTTEMQYHKTSVFYVYSKTAPKNPKTWLLDPSYDIRKNGELTDALNSLLDKGFEIGLHGSFSSATSLDRLAAEKDGLEKTMQTKINKTRQHWLRYFEHATPQIHEQLFDFDSTLGWNDLPGFRSGICSQYHPYDHTNQRAFKHLVTPQILMDSHLFDYTDDQAGSITKVHSWLRELKKFPSSFVSISWHPRTASSDYNWHHPYEQLLAEATKAGVL